MERSMAGSSTRLPLRDALQNKPANRERRFSDTDRHSSTIVLAPLVAKGNDHFHDPQTQRPSSPETPEPDSVASAHPLPPHICPSLSCAVARVLHTPELLTLILTHLRTDDVLSLRRVARNWTQAVCSAPQLRQHAFVHAQWRRPADAFALLDLPVRGLTIVRGEPLERGQRVCVRISLEAARKIVPEPGRRRVRSRSIYEGLRGGLGPSAGRGQQDVWPAPASVADDSGLRRSASGRRTGGREVREGDLFIVQPPVVGMQAFVDPSGRRMGEGVERAGGGQEAVACAKLACDAGITLGFLAETAQSLLMGTESALEHPDRASVEFRAIVSFCPPGNKPKRRGNPPSVIII